MAAENGSRRRAALSGGLWYAAAQFVPFFGTAVLSVVAGRLLGADRLGLQSLIAYVESLVCAALVQGLTSSCIRSLASSAGTDDKDSAPMAWWTVRAHLVMGAAAGLLLWGYAFVRGDGEISWWLAGASAVATSAGWAYGAVIAGRTGFRDVGRARLIAQLGAAGLAILAMVLGGDIAWIFIANIAASVWLTWVLWRRARLLPQVRAWRLPVPGVWRLYGMFTLGELVLQTVGRRSEFFFLDYFSSDSEIAMYSISFMVVTVAVSIPAALGAAIMPAVAQALATTDHGLVRQHLSRAVRVTAIMSLFLATALAVVGPHTVRLLYGSQYERAASFTALAAIAVVVVPVWNLCSDYWSGHGRLAPVLWTGLAGGLLDIAMAWILVPRLGALGAIVANVIGQMTMACLLIYHTWRTHDRFPLVNLRWVLLLGWCVVNGSAASWLCRDLSPAWAVLATIALITVMLASGALLIRPLSKLDAEWLAEVVPAPAQRLVVLLGS